jgi:hypothetical protein
MRYDSPRMHPSGEQLRAYIGTVIEAFDLRRQLLRYLSRSGRLV